MNDVFRALTLAALTLLLAPDGLVSTTGAAELRSASAPGAAQTVNVVETNWNTRFITNVIEISMPMNIFVTQYRTNQVQVLHTNVLDVYRTNWVAATLTNTIPVERTRTNTVTSYRTNWGTVNLTNWETVVAFKTNRVYRTLTNVVEVEQKQTNWVTRFHTNLNALTITNWETVLLFKTNWVTQRTTNQVAVNLTASPASTTGPVDPPNERAAPAAAAATALPPTTWELEAARTAKPPINNRYEVQLKLKSGSELAAAPLQEWRVDCTDGSSLLMMGRSREFKFELPLGVSKVDVRVRAVENGPALRVRGTVTVTRDRVATTTQS